MPAPLETPPAAHLPTEAGLAELLNGVRLLDVSEPAQLGIRTVKHLDGGGIAVLVWRELLVDVIVVHADGSREHDIVPRDELVGWLTRWAETP